MPQMKPALLAVILLAVALSGCRQPSPAEIRGESLRLRALFAKYQPEYRAALDSANALIPDSLAWLDGPAITAPRSQAVAGARVLMDKWARIYFVPRVIHEQLRFDEYSSTQARSAHRELLARMKLIYVELHDYQRYCQHAVESSMHGLPPGRLHPQLVEFRHRLQSRAPFTDTLSPLLDPK
jgi:hypothetical protein